MPTLLVPSITRTYKAPVISEIPVAPKSDTSILERIVELTNIERSKAGLEPLTLNMKLCQAADWMAHDMADNNYFDHMDHEGRRVGDRAFAFGYRAWQKIGENLGAGQENPEAVVAEWMSSPSHRRNLLKPEYTEIGVGYAENSGSTYHKYWVQTFGTRPSYVASNWK